MQGKRIPGQRKELAGQLTPTLGEGENGRLDEFWWACPPGGHATAVDRVIEHEDGTITAEFEQLGNKFYIDRGVWQPPALA